MQNEPGKERPFVRRTLPWIIAGAALFIYLLTLNPWMSLFRFNNPTLAFGNLNQVIRTSDLTWSPQVVGPAFYLATLPLHWLPAKWAPLMLNLFSALCAALALQQLARSVVLLPHNRTHEQRLREHGDHSMLSIPLAWVPPLLAVLVCGLQMTFWEHATNGTGAMFDLLLFAYVIRSLLEYRVDGKESRLLRAAFVYGLGMTNSFAMVGFLPVFIAAILWIRGLSFFHFGFLAGMALCGLAGMLLYLLMPLLATFSSAEPVSFWQALKANLVPQKQILFMFPQKTALALALTSLLPALVMSIRWASYMRVGDTSKLSALLATVMFHVFHAFFLFICIWVAFDPPFSPRHKGYGLLFLTFYYLGALSVGYFSGYFLLVFRRREGREGHGKGTTPALQKVHQVATVVIVALLAFSAIGLLCKNVPGIRATNSQAVKQFAATLAEGLPASGVLMSDDPLRLLLMQSWLARDGRDKGFLFLETQSLQWPAYHRHLHKKYPDKWEAVPEAFRTNLFTAAMNVNRLVKLAEKSEIYYLHPSFGYYFEVFYPEPHGMTYALRRYNEESLLPPKLTPELIAQNEAFWSKATDQALKPMLAARASSVPGENPSLLEQLFEYLHAPREKNFQIDLLGAYYSRSLNYWGVEMQKSSELEKAAGHFDLANKLNPENVVAQINLEFNKNLQAGISTPIRVTASMEGHFSKYRSLDQVLNANGPYDEPALCYLQAWTFMQARLFRESAQYFDRVRQLLPDDFASRLALAQIHLLANQPDKALALTGEIRENQERFHLNSTNRNDLVALEASTWFVKKEPDKARQMIQAAIEKSPKDVHLLVNAITVYSQRGEYTNALAVVERCLQNDPNNTRILITKGFICILIQDFDSATSALNRALEIEPENLQAMLNRGITYLRSDRLDDAKRDFEALEKNHPNQFQVHFGLGEIAWRQNDTNTAIRHYQAYLTNAPSGSAESRFVAGRLGQLKGEKTE